MVSSRTSLSVQKDMFEVHKEAEDDRVIALAGNPNVGKSTVFNALTGLNQHTGNWPGKTVTCAQGRCSYKEQDYIIVDLPGTYSLMPHSAEEEAARDFICFGGEDTTVVVCDATCMERNLNLVLQTMEITDRIVVCVNLLDEAKKKHISVHLKTLEEILGVPVVGTSARSNKGLDHLLERVSHMEEYRLVHIPRDVLYDQNIEEALKILTPVLQKKLGGKIRARWMALRILEGDDKTVRQVEERCGGSLLEDADIKSGCLQVETLFKEKGIDSQIVKDQIVGALMQNAERIWKASVSIESKKYEERQNKIDYLLTGKYTGIPIMLLLLGVIFWITIAGANYPSKLITVGLFWVQDRLTDFFQWIQAPEWLHGALVLGVYRVLAWVVSVMLPPMAIFFPLFTLLEDLGYLPRIAFNLDHHFQKACACGKQCLTMCMGFGCNAAGVVGCRIIDSPRERLIAIITNNFVPCNGRFPTLIAIISMFFVGTFVGPTQTFVSVFILLSVIILSVFMTFEVSKLLSKTILKGLPSSFTLELPPYRTPQVGKVIVRSIFDRTLFVLGRAIVIAAPAGLIIWLMANVSIGGVTILAHCSGFLDPFAQLMGLDGVILIAFILGFPANEIVVPIIIMAYMATGTITDMGTFELKQLLVSNGWTWVTAVSTMLFCLFHWPCSTTCLTIKKETQSWKWTLVSFAVPTIIGIFICMLFHGVVTLLGFA